MSDPKGKNSNYNDALLETPHYMILKKLFSDSKLSDITLEANDGSKVEANRCILAARSEVFRKMLYGDFREAMSSVVKVNYRGDILKALVQYCYMDRVSMLGAVEENEKNNDAQQQHYPCCYDDTWARKLVELNTAADFFGLGGLQQQIYSVGCSKMAKHEATLSCAFFDAAKETALGISAIELIRERPEEALFPQQKWTNGHAGLLSLSSTSLADVAGDTMLQTDEFTLFRALKIWSEADISMIPPTSPHDFCPSKRKQIATELVAKNVDLKRIKPSDLCNSVEKSGLVTAHAVAEAFKAQALMFDEKIPTYHLPLWKGSDNAIFCRKQGVKEKSTMLKCFPMKSGFHTWTIEYIGRKISGRYYDELGIATAIPKRCEWLSSDLNNSWVLRPDGKKLSSFGHDGVAELSFQKGESITFTLDLSKNGCLSASVAGGDSIILFDDLLSTQNNEGGEASFFPAVALSERNSVRISSFKSKHLVST